MRNGLQTWLLVVGILLFVPRNINAMTIAPIRPDFEVDGINYKIIDAIAQTVRVVQSVDKYQGAVFVSETVTYSGITYSVTEIGKSAFDDCTGLTSVTIPNSVTEIGSYAFRNTGWYNNQLDGVLYLDNCCLGYKGDEPTGSLSINSGTRLIANAAFKNCRGLDDIFIPNSVARIGGEAFWYSGLETVHFEDGEISVSLGYGIRLTKPTVDYCGIFEGNPLKSVYIGRDIVSDEMEAKPFGYFNDLNSVVFGKKVTTIENGAFEGSSAISSVTSLNIIPPVCLSDSTFDDAVYKNATLYVPKASIGRYATADVWNKFESVAVSGVESVKNDSYNSVEVARYDIHGRLLSAPTQGINIVIYSDGTTRKEFVK